MKVCVFILGKNACSYISYFHMWQKFCVATNESCVFLRGSFGSRTLAQIFYIDNATPDKPHGDIGDTNLDGTVNICDVTTIQRYLTKAITFTDEQLAVADTNGDGKVDINDATYLQMYLARYGVTLGISAQ